MIPADIDLPELMSIKFRFLIYRGNDEFVYKPKPSSPFLPDPQVQISASLDLVKETKGNRMEVAKAAAFQNLLNFIKYNLDIKQYHINS